MPSPFPGMDPYIECYGNWQDFHNCLMANICNSLGVSLPPDYYPRTHDRVETVAFVDVEKWDENDCLPVEDIEWEEVHETRLEIRGLPDLELVTSVELMSPITKIGPSRAGYLERRRDLLASGVNLVEIDLLLRDLPSQVKLPSEPAGYRVVTNRHEKTPAVDVLSWTIRDPLPKIRIPLRAFDLDDEVDLGTLVHRVYDRGRYARTLYRIAKLPEFVPVSVEDREWAEGLANSMRLTS